MADPLGLAGASEAVSKFAIRLVDVCQVGIGGIFSPWQVRRMARAEGDAEKIRRLATAQAELETAQLTADAQRLRTLAATVTELEAEQIRARGRIAVDKLQIQAKHELESFRSNIEVKALPAECQDPDEPHVEWVLDDGTEIQRIPVEPLPQRTKSRLDFQEAKRQTNVEQVVSHAFNEEPPEGTVSDETVDPDWVARFFDNVKDVSNEHVQKLWGKLLAEEVAKPGTFSLRTLDILRNLTSTEARLFERYCGYISLSGELIVPDGTDFLAQTGLQISELRTLVDCGLFMDGKEFIKSSTAKSEPQSIICNGRGLKISAESKPVPPPQFLDIIQQRMAGAGKRSGTSGAPESVGSGLGDHFMRSTLTGTIFRLTGAGIELANLRMPDVDDHYIDILAKAIRDKGFDVDIVVIPGASDFQNGSIRDDSSKAED